jgi:cellulose synthase/poly-beta-1,6-N-acetylglucosamine synthase-like glycosyltransferase
MIADYILSIIYFFTIFTSLVYIMIYITNKKNFIKKYPIKKQPTFTILIPAYNVSKYIFDTLTSVNNINYPKEKLNVIVVNDGSTDNTLEIIKKFKGIKLINKTNGGKASALNVGIKNISSDYTLILDADTLIEPDIIIKSLPYFENPKNGVVIPTLRPYKANKLLQKFQVVEYAISTFVRALMSMHNALPAAPACTIFRTEVLKKTKGYDEKNLTEDFEISLQVKKLGYDIFNAINVSAYTYVPDNVKSLYRQRLRWCYGTIYNLKKHKDIFGTKNGDLGWFFMPLFVTSVFFGMVLLIMMGYDLFNNSYQLLRNLMLINFNFIFSFDNFSIMNYLTSLKTILSFVAIVMSLYLFYQVKKYYCIDKDSNIKLYKYIAFIIFYTPFLLYVFFVSVLFFIIRYEPKW